MKTASSTDFVNALRECLGKGPIPDTTREYRHLGPLTADPGFTAHVFRSMGDGNRHVRGRPTEPR